MKISTLSHREDYVKKKRKEKIRRAVFFCVLCILLCIGVVYLLRRPSLRIDTVTLSGQLLVDPQEMTKTTLDFLEGSYVYIIPKNNSIVYPKQALVEHIRNVFPRIEEITISRDGLSGLAIAIKERGFEALWCGPEPRTEEVCYFVDSNAVIFAEAPQFSGDAYTVYYGPVPEEPVVGHQFVPSTVFQNTQAIVEQAKKLKLFPRKVVFDQSGDYKVFLYTGAYVVVSTKDDPQEVNRHLALLVNTLSDRQLQDLDYIDMRFGNKLFYKFKSASTDTTP